MNLWSQGTAGIYKVRWFIDNRLTNQVVFNNGNGGTNRLNIPPNLYDSVINVIKNTVQNELHVDARYVYSLNRKGEEKKTSNTSEFVGGLPRGTKRQAMKVEYVEYYVKFKINVGLSKSVGVGNAVATYSRLRPYVSVKMKAYGVDRRRKFHKRTRLGGFQSIGSFQYNVGGTTVTNNNAMPIAQVLDMVFQGLEKFKNKAR